MCAIFSLVLRGKTLHTWFVWPSNCIQFRTLIPPSTSPQATSTPPLRARLASYTHTLVEHSQPAHTSAHTTPSNPFLPLYFENCSYFHIAQIEPLLLSRSSSSFDPKLKEFLFPHLQGQTLWNWKMCCWGIGMGIIHRVQWVRWQITLEWPTDRSTRTIHARPTCPSLLFTI